MWEKHIEEDRCCVYCGTQFDRILELVLRLCTNCGQDYIRERTFNREAINKMKFVTKGDRFRIVWTIDFVRDEDDEMEVLDDE